MTGGIIYVNHIPSAFTLGEPLTADTFDVHFEKQMTVLTASIL